MPALAEAFVRLRSDPSALYREVPRQVAGVPGMEKAGKQAGQKVGGGMVAGFKTKVKGLHPAAVGAIAAAGTMLAARAGRALLQFGKDSVGAARDLAETESKTRVLFGTATPAIQKFAKGAADSLGQSKQQAMDAASTFAVFGKSAGLQGPELAGFSTKLVSLTSDMASFSNTTPEEAIEAVGAALRGETEPIRKYGVLLDDASMRQQALKMGLIKTTKEALTPQQKVLAAQALIFAQTKAAQGDFARTSGGLANQQRILNARMENLKATLGKLLLPVVLAVTRGLSAMAGFMQRNGKWAGPLIGILAGLAATIFLIVKATQAWTAIQLAFNVIMAANPVVLIIMAVVALGVALVVAYKKSETFRNVVNAVFQSVWGVIKFVWGWIKTYWPLLITILLGPFGALIVLVTKNLTTFKNLVRGAFDVVRAIVQLWWRAYMHPILKAWASAFRVAVDTIKWIWTSILSPTIDKIKGAFKAIGSTFSTMWRNVLRPAFTFLVRSFLWVVGTIIHGAAKAFGWMGPIGKKLRNADREFRDFARGVNRNLDRINDESVTVNIKTRAEIPSGVSVRQLMGRAAGGAIPGYGGGDIVPAMLEPGEHVWTKAEVRAAGGHTAVEEMRRQVRGYARGGVILDPRFGGTWQAVNTQRRMARGIRRGLTRLVRDAWESVLPASVGGGTRRWASTVSRALGLLGLPGGLRGSVLVRIQHESGGNPYAVNRSDINWRRGTPSVGLMQVIGPTFRSYAGRFRRTGPFMYGTSVNPLANIYAGLNYAQHRYGRRNLGAVMVRGGGYDNGGLLPPGLSLAWNGTGHPEPVGAGPTILFRDCVFVGGSDATWDNVFVRAYEKAKAKGRIR